LRIAGVIPFVILLSTRTVLAQSAPVSPDHPWQGSAEVRLEIDARNIPGLKFTIDSAKTYSLAELVDFAETHNPQTRVEWERARSRAAALGVARSELYPTLAAAALSETSRSEAFFGGQFYKQVRQDFELALELNYTVLDFGGRSGRINAAMAQLLAANFSFNDTHRNVIFQVQTAYYRVLSTMGQEDAARASLANAQAVQQAAEDRLAHGLATMPDVLEARSATAQADYELQALLGAEEIARGDLATAIGAPATTAIRVQPLDQVPTRESMGDTAEQAIDRALGQRPDLMQQVAEIRSANARVKEARAAYYPTLSLMARSALPSLYGLQQPSPWGHASDLTGGIKFNLNWTVFDGGSRKNRLAQAEADVRGAEAGANVARNRIADEVWTAYSNLNTAFRQRQAAVVLLEAASQSYSAALESYNYGVRSLLDVTAAQRTLAQARSTDVVARTQVLTAIAELAFRTGDSIRAHGRPGP
jgi:outer membrane protein TolC